MVVHAENEKQKKIVAQHICLGYVCKNCKNYHKSVIVPSTGYCSRFNTSGLSGSEDFCSLIEIKQG